ncbi:hypothetical protein L208DRAFT_53997 [Tricholoma matsutake]|nr:hypothetical protein L208DRAFT_53997 [Tricholoma matsutake 945]
MNPTRSSSHPCLSRRRPIHLYASVPPILPSVEISGRSLSQIGVVNVLSAWNAIYLWQIHGVFSMGGQLYAGTNTMLTASCEVGGKASVSSFWYAEQSFSRWVGGKNIARRFARRQHDCISAENSEK